MIGVHKIQHQWDLHQMLHVQETMSSKNGWGKLPSRRSSSVLMSIQLIMISLYITFWMTSGLAWIQIDPSFILHISRKTFLIWMTITSVYLEQGTLNTFSNDLAVSISHRTSRMAQAITATWSKPLDMTRSTTSTREKSTLLLEFFKMWEVFTTLYSLQVY